MKILLYITFILLTFRVNAQENDTIIPPKRTIITEELSKEDTISGGKVIIHSDPKINKLLEVDRNIKRTEGSFDGYRIQILSISSYRANVDTLNNMVKRFENEFPGVPAYLQYQDPDFKIRVGNFRSRIEAQPTLNKIRKKYPSSYPVKDVILYKDMNRRTEVDSDPEDRIIVPVE